MMLGKHLEHILINNKKMKQSKQKKAGNEHVQTEQQLEDHIIQPFRYLPIKFNDISLGYLNQHQNHQSSVMESYHSLPNSSLHHQFDTNNASKQTAIPSETEATSKTYESLHEIGKLTRSPTSLDSECSMNDVHQSIGYNDGIQRQNKRERFEQEEEYQSMSPSDSKSVALSNWSIEEDIILCELHKKMGNNWAYISSCLTGKNRIEVKTRYRSITRAAKRFWSPNESNLLINLFMKHGQMWDDEISYHFPNRTKNSIKVHLKRLTEARFDIHIYPNGSPVNVLMARPDLAQSILSSSHSLSSSSLVSDLRKNILSGMRKDIKELSEWKNSSHINDNCNISEPMSRMRNQNPSTLISQIDSTCCEAKPTGSIQMNRSTISPRASSSDLIPDPLLLSDSEIELLMNSLCD